MGGSYGERFSGHESFVCRYGWLPKIHKAIQRDPKLLKNDELAMNTLGIGRNMVKSLQFWAEVSGIIVSQSPEGHTEGPVGAHLFGEFGWDPYLESRESLWLIHWQLSTKAGLAAWNEIFGEGKQTRFDRQQLISSLMRRGIGAARSLAASTLEQHASIFIQSYYQAERSSDDTSWCPLQDLGLVKATKAEDGRILYNTSANVPIGLSPRVFGIALADFITNQASRASTVDFIDVLRGEYSPGVVFRLDEHQLRQLVDDVIAGPFSGALRFVDTADTQSIVLVPDALDPQYLLGIEEVRQDA